MIQLTEKAIKEINRLRSQDQSLGEALLRIMVVGGGCSGMSYKLGFETTPPDATDKQIECNGIKIVIDPKSYLYIAGIELDFSDGLNGSGFVFNNPNAKRTCGCGSSFSA